MTCQARRVALPTLAAVKAGLALGSLVVTALQLLRYSNVLSTVHRMMCLWTSACCGCASVVPSAVILLSSCVNSTLESLSRIERVSQAVLVQNQPPPTEDLSDDKFAPPPMPQEFRSDFR